MQVFQPWIQKRKLEYVRYKHLMLGILTHLRQHALGKLLNDDGEPDPDIVKKYVLLCLFSLRSSDTIVFTPMYFIIAGLVQAF